MATDIAALLADLRDETTVVDGLLTHAGAEEWHQATAAAGWSIVDQVSHLAYFDEATTTAINDPRRFRREADDLVAAGPGFPDLIAERFRTMPPAELLAWFRLARHDLLTTLAMVDPGTRIPWYGPPMSVTSAATARLMETWAHGLDIAGALGVAYPVSMRLRHVAHLGVRTFGFSFANRGLDIPEAEVAVRLTAPDGSLWTWGDPADPDRIEGPALDFCLVVTQRRHLADTALVVHGPVADRWITMAQAFAGPPGPGRARVGSPPTVGQWNDRSAPGG